MEGQMKTGLLNQVGGLFLVCNSLSKRGADVSVAGADGIKY